MSRRQMRSRPLATPYGGRVARKSNGVMVGVYGMVRGTYHAIARHTIYHPFITSSTQKRNFFHLLFLIMNCFYEFFFMTLVLHIHLGCRLRWWLPCSVSVPLSVPVLVQDGLDVWVDGIVERDVTRVGAGMFCHSVLSSCSDVCFILSLEELFGLYHMLVILVVVTSGLDRPKRRCRGHRRRIIIESRKEI